MMTGPKPAKWPSKPIGQLRSDSFPTKRGVITYPPIATMKSGGVD